MGNKTSSDKAGFYTPTISPLPPQTTHSKNKLPELDIIQNSDNKDDNPTYPETDIIIQSPPTEQNMAMISSPDSDIDDGDIIGRKNSTSYFRPTFHNDISDMLTEIASEIDGQYSNKNKTITVKISNNHNNDPTLRLLDDLTSANTNSFTGATPEPELASFDSKSTTNGKRKRPSYSVKRHKYAHISLDFVPSQNYVHKISQKFTYIKQLGCGASCRVLLVNENKSPSNKYALKEMQISDQLNRLLFATEYKILQLLDGHKNIISYHSSWIDKNCYYLSTAYCSGGTMLDRIIKQGHFNEAECSEFIKNVLHGIQYMHKMNIVHRDIKCENLIFDKEGSNGNVKIIDFGNSEIIKNPKQIDKILIGSLHYLPPEMLSSKIRIKEMLYKGICSLINL